MAAKKKERNYFLDFWKVIASLLVMCFHASMLYGQTSRTYLGYYEIIAILPAFP